MIHDLWDRVYFIGTELKTSYFMKDKLNQEQEFWKEKHYNEEKQDTNIIQKHKSDFATKS